jgi:hypothetical protein
VESLEVISKTTVIAGQEDGTEQEQTGPLAELVMGEATRKQQPPETRIERNTKITETKPVPQPAASPPVVDKDPSIAAMQAAVTPVPEFNSTFVAKELPAGESVTTEADGAPADDKSPTLLAKTTVPEDAAAEPTSEICTRFGPILNQDTAGKMLALLQQQELPAQLSRTTREINAGYWVLLPPFSSGSAARKGLAILKGQGVKDVAVVNGGDFRNAISLGVFSKQASMQRRLRQMQKLGYKPLVHERKEEQTVSWLEVTGPSSLQWSDLPAAVRQLLADPVPAGECAASTE